MPNEDELPRGAVRRLGSARFRCEGVASMALSPDGTIIVTGARSYEMLGVTRWDAASGRALSTFTAAPASAESGKSIEAVALSPDGSQIAGIGNDNLFVWDVATGACHSFAGWRHFRGPLTFTPDGRHLIAVSGGAHPIRVFNVVARTLEREISGVELPLVYAGPNEVTAPADLVGKVLVDTSNGTRHSFDEQRRFDACIAVSPDGERFFAGTFGARKVAALRTWDFASGAVIDTLELGDLRGNPGWRGGMGIARDGRRAGVMLDDRTLAVWDLRARRRLVHWALDEDELGPIERCVFSPDLRWLVIIAWASRVNTLRQLVVIDVERGTIATRLSAASQVCFSGDGSELVSEFWGELRRYDVGTWTERARPSGHRDWVRGLAFSSDGAQLTSVAAPGQVIIWDVAAGSALRQADLDEDGHLVEGDEGTRSAFRASAAISSDGRVLALTQPRLRETSLDTWALPSLAPLESRRSGLEQASVAAVNRTFAIVRGLGYDGARHVGQWVALADATQGGGFYDGAAAISPDGRLVACAERSDLHLQSAPWHELAVRSRVARAHREQIFHLVFSPDGKVLASASKHTVKLWRADGKRLVEQETVAHRKKKQVVRGLAFTPDGQRLAVGDNGGVFIWRIGGGEGRDVAKQKATSVAFSSDGRMLASGHHAVVLLWPVPEA